MEQGQLPPAEQGWPAVRGARAGVDPWRGQGREQGWLPPADPCRSPGRTQGGSGAPHGRGGGRRWCRERRRLVVEGAAERPGPWSMTTRRGRRSGGAAVSSPLFSSLSLSLSQVEFRRTARGRVGPTSGATLVMAEVLDSDWKSFLQFVRVVSPPSSVLLPFPFSLSASDGRVIKLGLPRRPSLPCPAPCKAGHQIRALPSSLPPSRLTPGTLLKP
jgi:hypothetical protein